MLVGTAMFLMVAVVCDRWVVVAVVCDGGVAVVRVLTTFVAVPHGGRSDSPGQHQRR